MEIISINFFIFISKLYEIWNFQEVNSPNKMSCQSWQANKTKSLIQKKGGLFFDEKDVFRSVPSDASVEKKKMKN